jgi:hypothetical protein
MHRCLAGRDQGSPGGRIRTRGRGAGRRRAPVRQRGPPVCTRPLIRRDHGCNAVLLTPGLCAFRASGRIGSLLGALGCRPSFSPNKGQRWANAAIRTLEQFHISPSTATRLPSTPEAIHHPASTEPRTPVRGPLGLPSATALLFSSSSRGAQRSVEPRRERTARLRSRLCAGGALRARRYRITASKKSG